MNGLSVTTVIHLQIPKMMFSMSAAISTKKNELKMTVVMNPHYTVNFRKRKGDFISHVQIFLGPNVTIFSISCPTQVEMCFISPWNILQSQQIISHLKKKCKFNLLWLVPVRHLLKRVHLAWKNMHDISEQTVTENFDQCSSTGNNICFSNMTAIFERCMLYILKISLWNL